MSREQNIPLVLWISTAIVTHIMGVGGADQIARTIEDRVGLHAYAVGLRDKLRPPATIEVTFDGQPSPAGPEAEAQPPDDDAKPPPPPPLPPPPPQQQARAAPPTPPPQEQKPKPDEVQPPITLLPKVAASAAPAEPPPPPPEPKADRRIAVRQHVEPNQQDNPNARHIGDEANHVAEESVARITSHDRDDQNPTPGGQHHGPNEEIGNADQTRVGESEDRPGEQKRAPGERGASPEPMPAARTAAAPPGAANGSRADQRGAQPPAPSPPQEPIATGDGYSLDPVRRDPPSPRAASQSGNQAPRITSLQMLGLGGQPLANGVNLNLTQQGVVASVGQDQLTRERMADGERRRSQHRGSWRSSGFERWRSAIENYVSSVKYGNNTALNTARVPFATYLNSIHNRIHPIFADDFLMTLEGLPPSHPMNDPKMIARLEIVLEPREGRLVRMGIIKTSGVTAFDVAALDSVQRASPFGKAPNVIVSADGNVYLHWEFHRDPLYACSTAGASPYMLTTPPATKEPTSPKAPPTPIFPPGDPRERGRPDARQGLAPLPTSPSRDLTRGRSATAFIGG